MDNSRTLLVGLPSSPGFRTAKLFSSVNLDEFSYIIWEIASLEQELNRASKFDGTVMTQDTKEIVEAHVNANVDRLMRWVRAGHRLIAISHKPLQMVWADIFDRRNYYELDARLIVKGIQPRAVTGARVEYVGPKQGEPFLEKFIHCFSYEVLLGGGAVSPLLKVSRGSKGPPQIVAGFKKIGDGIVVLIPPAPAVTSPDKNATQFYEALVSLAQTLAAEPGADIPAWAANYQTAPERAAHEQIAQYRAEISRLETLVGGQEAILGEATNLKALFAGTGNAFASAVQNALIELGLKVVEGPHPRADLLAFDGKRVLAIEAKGLEGPSKEADLRQVERWLAEVRAALIAGPEQLAADSDLERYVAQLRELGVPLDIDAPVPTHGLMVIGTFRQTLLRDRKDADFPEPVAKVISRTDICAITGLQLMGLVLSSRDQSTEKERIIDMLFSTSGILLEQSDWRTFLTSV